MTEEMAFASSQESLPLSQETYDCLWQMVSQNGYDEHMITEVNEQLRVVPVAPADLQPAYPVRSSLPATEDWPGVFSFNVSFTAQENNSKHSNWIYSEKDRKLFVKKDVSCPINFSTNKSMTNDVIVRAMAVFTSPEHASDAVHRCVNHSMTEIKEGKVEAEHIIRCESLMAMYQIDPDSKRQSVVVPFENPAAGQCFATYLYKFMCFSSCSGGPNRRPLTLVFTLEQSNLVIGRRVMELKICACPGRDSRDPNEKSSPVASGSKKKIVCEPSDMFSMIDTSVSPKKKSPAPKEKSEYIIKVKDYECYKFLKQQKEAFKLYKSVKMLPPEFKLYFQMMVRSSDEDEKS